MANNRLILVDDATGERHCLAKTHGGGWYQPGPDDALDAWLGQRDAAASIGNCEGRSTLRLIVENEEP